MRYTVVSTYLNSDGYNDQIFEALGYRDERARFKLASECYGHETNSGIWPEFRNYSQATNLVMKLYNLIEGISTKEAGTHSRKTYRDGDYVSFYYNGSWHKYCRDRCYLRGVDHSNNHVYKHLGLTTDYVSGFAKSPDDINPDYKDMFVLKTHVSNSDGDIALNKLIDFMFDLCEGKSVYPPIPKTVPAATPTIPMPTYKDKYSINDNVKFLVEGKLYDYTVATRNIYNVTASDADIYKALKIGDCARFALMHFDSTEVDTYYTEQVVFRMDLDSAKQNELVNKLIKILVKKTQGKSIQFNNTKTKNKDGKDIIIVPRAVTTIVRGQAVSGRPISGRRDKITIVRRRIKHKEIADRR